MEGSSKRSSGSKKKQTRPKVRANLGEPARFRLQDEPDTTPQFQPPFSQNQPFIPPYQNPSYPPFQTQMYQNQPFIPPYQPYPNYQTQQSQTYSNTPLDPLEDNTLIHQFATAYREPQQHDDEDEDDEEEEAVQEEEDEDEEEEAVREEDIIPQSGGRRPWTSAEEVALTKAYLHVSENKKHANEQRNEMFWRRVISHFAKLLGSTSRNMDQMTSKWGDLNRKMNPSTQSGASENTIIQNAIKVYCNTYRHKSFPHMASWEIARHHAKWVPVPLVDMDGPTAPRKKGAGAGAGGSKRSKTSESGNYTTSTDGLSSNIPEMNLNDEPGDDEEQDDTPTKPQRKAKGKGTVSDQATEYTAARLQDLADKKAKREEALALKAKREEAYMEHLAEHQKNNDLNVVLQPHDHLDEPFRSILLSRKREICRKWGWQEP